MTEAEILAAVYGLIDDLKGKFVPEGEMRLHMHAVARDFAKRARVMREPRKLVTYLPTGLLTLPEDCEELMHMEQSDGREICPLSLTQMACRYGEGWQTQAGIPEYYTRDLTGVDQIRFSHIPAEAGTVALSYVKGHVPGNSIEILARYHDALVWGIAAKSIAKSGNDGDQLKIARFGTLYEEGVQEARRDATKNFSNHVRRIPYQSF